MNISDSVSEILGIGPKYKALLSKLGIETVEDFLLHIPYRYDDRSKIVPVSGLTSNEKTTVIGLITQIRNVFTRNGKRITSAKFEDQTGRIDVIWFNQHYLTQTLKPGVKVALFGSLDAKSVKPQLTAPEWELLNEADTILSGFRPVYPLTDGLTNKWL